MAHRSFSDLEIDLERASKQVKVGGIYTHRKGHQYLVTDLVIAEVDDTISVIYHEVDHQRVKFARPLNNWLEEVDGIPRFRMVDQSKEE